MYCSFLFINDRVWWMYMFVDILFKLSMSVYGYESVSCVCLCLSDEPVLFCIYVWKIGVLFTCLDGPREDKLWTLNKVFELNWIQQLNKWKYCTHITKYGPDIWYFGNSEIRFHGWKNRKMLISTYRPWTFSKSLLVLHIIMYVC